jgi:hypothetical protein
MPVLERSAASNVASSSDPRAARDRHVNPDDPPVVLEHRCRAVFHSQITCASCGEVVRRDDVAPVA